MRIRIPSKFDSLLSDQYRAFIGNAVSLYSEIYKNNKVEFFQDYTDHGIEHIQEVLQTAESIIDEDSFQFLNEKDIFVLVFSVLLHDIGMHISREGVKKILDPSFDSWRILYFDGKSWNDEWLNYFQEVKRFNDEQLKNVFGTSDQIINAPDLDNVDDYTRRLYGEFLRRHHHRLAHEIALGGFPTQIGTDNILIPAGDIESDIFDLAGLIARSHGMPVRKAIDYLENTFKDGWRSPYDIKAVFLMVVLRIADYLQIHPERASKVILKSKKFSSPVSKMEWEKHSAIKDINVKTADPERIFVIAKPANSVIYLELEKLFDDIQAEFDISWAVLGEVYGKDKELKNLKIKFRRIRSVLDDKDDFAKAVNYIPQRVFFNADPSLLKLLIGPLYGEDPKYGVRELLQNAIDAIKEREYLKDIQGKVTITLKPIKKGKPRYELTMTDTGIGMTKDTIINYFFKAGASFRKSMSWKKNFVDDNEVKIQKTGRFGVGVLAVFLLGDEFEMWTKYDDTNSQGYFCKASLSMTQVELEKNDCRVGTTIKIILRDTVNGIINSVLSAIESASSGKLHDEKLLEWFTWYVMDKPNIEYVIEKTLIGAFRFINPSMKISSHPDLPLKEWRAFVTKDYRSIHWTIHLQNRIFDYYGQRLAPEHDDLVCNGFKVPKGHQIRTTYPGLMDWSRLKISVFDNDGKLPLSLNRDYIQESSLPFSDELIEHIHIEIINSVLKTEFNQYGNYFVPNRNILSLYGNIDLSEFIIVTGDEFTILNSFIFSMLKISEYTQFWFRNKTNIDTYNFTPDSPYQASYTNSDTIAFYRDIITATEHNWMTIMSSNPRNDSFSRSYIASEKLRYLLLGNRLPKTFKQKLRQNKLDKYWSEIIVGDDVVPSDINVEKLNPDIYPLIIRNYTRSAVNDKDLLIKTWVKYLDEEWTFPIDKSKRPELIKFR
jgi:molecular chaperone HtpG